MKTKANTTKRARDTGAKATKKRTAKATKRVDPVPPDIAAKFEGKLGQLKETGIPRIGPVGPIRKLPDGGWQMDCGNAITIAMAPDTPAPFAVTGAIRDKWLEEGGAFDEAGNPGKLGYPVSDTIPYTSMGRAADRISRFQEGDITWNSAKEVCYVSLNKPQFENAEESLSEGKGLYPVGDAFPVWPAPQSNEQPSSISKFIESLSTEEKFEALEKLVAAIKADAEELQARCYEAEEALDEAESSRDEDEDE